MAHNEEVGNVAAYESMMAQVKEELGDTIFVIAELLSHGLTKRKVAKALNIPYPELKQKVLLLRKYFSKEYHLVGGKSGGKKKRRTAKKGGSK